MPNSVFTPNSPAQRRLDALAARHGWIRGLPWNGHYFWYGETDAGRTAVALADVDNYPRSLHDLLVKRHRCYFEGKCPDCGVTVNYAASVADAKVGLSDEMLWEHDERCEVSDEGVARAAKRASRR